MKRIAAAAVLLAGLQIGALAQRSSSRESLAPGPDGAAARRAIIAAEDSRLALPDDLHTPGIDTIREQQMADLRLLLEFARSKDLGTRATAIRALGRLERREVIPDLLTYLTSGPTDETAEAIAQAFRGPALPGDTEGQQVGQALDALLAAGAIPADPRGSGPIGPVSLAVGRLPYERANQVKAAESYLLRVLRAADTDSLVRPALGQITRGMEILTRTHGRLAALSSDSVEQLRNIAVNRGHGYGAAERISAMQALIAARGVDEDTLRAVARSESPSLKRLAAVVLGGAAAPVTATERMELLTELLRDSSIIVRIEAVGGWARQESTRTGCQRLLDTLADRSVPVVLAVIDALGDSCPQDLNVTDRLTSEAKAPGAANWQRASHALVALAKRTPGRAFISLLGGHVQHETWQVRMYAARAAGIANDVASLERLAYDPDDNVREATLAPLRRLKGDEAEPYLVAALGRSDYQLLRTAAIELKGSRPTAPVAAGLLEALRRVTAERKETSRDTRLALLERLPELGSADQAGALVPLLRDFDIPIAQAAAAVIQGWIGRSPEIDPQVLPRPAVPADASSPPPPARVKMKSGKAFTINLRPGVAPLTVSRFVRLAGDGYYDGLSFHRVVSNFVIQGGSPGSNEYSGDTIYMRDEISSLSHTRGTVGLSTRGRDTGDAQFFVNLVDNPRLDFEYTIFGELENAADADEILEGDVIATITFEKDDSKNVALPVVAAPQCYAEGAFGHVDDNGCVVPLRSIHRRRQLLPAAARH
jgi:cyclophilin family peptidyl-prolyl cis-trans isomerase/HEAT repeat protein